MIIILQIHSGITLILGLLIIIVILWLFWPQKGGFALFKKLNKNNQRVHLEDALKFMFDYEYKKLDCDINSIAGNLNISADKAGKLINRLATMELININDQKILLTDTGRSYALRVIRVHRVWERYLADETSVAPADWHTEADRLEHNVTIEETEKVAAQLGNPVYDPHGDPIPSSDGKLPDHKGESLSTFKEGQIGRITHLEDEPKSIYEQLVVLGLYPGMQVYVTDVTENKITFIADGEECVLTKLFAGCITVEEVKEKVQQQKHELLSSLNVGEQAEIAGISPNCRGQQRRRLMDFGIIPGSKIAAVMKSASGDPVGYRVMGTTIGIRRKQADLIFINRKN